jgi:hypothetical protein
VLSTAREQALYASRLLAPNLVAYFNDPLPPPRPFPATPGKIPSEDNPYALGAAFEAGSLLPLGPEGAVVGPLGRAAVGAAEKAAAETSAMVAAEAPALTRAGEDIVTGPYGSLIGTLPEGWQAHHLNQNAVYGRTIPRNEGLSVAVKGNAFSDQGTQHYAAHQWLEGQFWNQYRRGGSLYPSIPTKCGIW